MPNTDFKGNETIGVTLPNCCDDPKGNLGVITNDKTFLSYINLAEFAY